MVHARQGQPGDSEDQAIAVAVERDVKDSEGPEGDSEEDDAFNVAVARAAQASDRSDGIEGQEGLGGAGEQRHGQPICGLAGQDGLHGLDGGRRCHGDPGSTSHSASHWRRVMHKVQAAVRQK
jgi:hypothetical protein